jgi:hypothetical protein
MSAKRPRRHDEAVILAAAEQMAPAYAEWCQEEPGPGFEHSLAKAMRFNDDAYKIVRELERFDGIDGDEELVDIMSRAGIEIYDAYKDALKKWVSENGVVPSLEINASVETRDGPGKIVDVDSAHGTYCVCVEAHKKGSGYIGTILPFEDVSPSIAQVQP